MAGSSDEDLLACVAEGDEAALAATYDRHSTLVYSLALRVLGDAGAAEDLVQEMFLHVWRRPSEYVAARGSVRTWLLAITRNRAIDQLRRREAGARRQVALEGLETQKASVDPPDLAENTVLGSQVRGYLTRLPEAQARVLTLAYYGGFSQSEIAEMLEVPIGTVKSRLRLGLDALRSLFGERGEVPA